MIFKSTILFKKPKFSPLESPENQKQLNYLLILNEKNQGIGTIRSEKNPKSNHVNPNSIAQCPISRSHSWALKGLGSQLSSAAVAAHTACLVSSSQLHVTPATILDERTTTLASPIPFGPYCNWHCTFIKPLWRHQASDTLLAPSVLLLSCLRKQHYVRKLLTHCLL